ncbi:MAG TPA: hypothetical protein ENN88_03375, partial [Candidatus Coatesbacteria bacterium]|nr:hypothetical protein [Candidatus Coatesbacteria bacterium]
MPGGGLYRTPGPGVKGGRLSSSARAGYTSRATASERKMTALFLLLTALFLIPAAAGPLVEEPNELGDIPILMYHHVSDRVNSIYNVPPAVFENHLLQFYEAGFVLVSLSDYCDDAFLVPRGSKPLVITFDDGHENNFRLLPDGSIDPACAVGVLESFARERPDFGRTAAFFVNAGPWAVPFGDAATAGEKLRWLVENGYDIGNHTADHHNLRNCDPYQVRRQIGLCQAALYELCPELEGRVRFFAYPYGIAPRDPKGFEVVESGSFNGVAYRMELCLRAWEYPAPSPASPVFERLRLAIPRIEMHVRESGNGHTPRWVADRPNLY